MKRILLCALLLSTLTIGAVKEEDATAEINTVAPKPKNSRQNAKIVLANLANIIGQIGNIIQEPRNAAKVTASVTGMVSSIINLTVNVLENKNNNNNKTNYDTKSLRSDLTELYADLTDDITALIVAKAIVISENTEKSTENYELISS